MTVALTPDPQRRRERFARGSAAEPVRRRFVSERSVMSGPSTSGGLTLDDVLVGVWEDLAGHRTAVCPVCGGRMAPRYGAGAAPVGGRCADCRSTIA